MATAEETLQNAPETPRAEPESGLEARGRLDGDSETGEINRGHLNAKKGFSKAGAFPNVPLALGFPLWPDEPITLRLDYLLSGDAEREQRQFLGLTDEEQREAQYSYDCRLLSLLICEPPEGIADFPALPDPFDAGDETHRKALTLATFSYFYTPDEPERARALRYIVRNFMARYWSKVLPRDYL